MHVTINDTPLVGDPDIDGDTPAVDTPLSYNLNNVWVWAGDDLRSVNAQVEFLLRRALRDARRLPAEEKRDQDHAGDSAH